MVVASEQHLYQTVLPRKLATGSIHDYLLCYCPLVGILFEVLRISFNYIYLQSTNTLSLAPMYMSTTVDRIDKTDVGGV